MYNFSVKIEITQPNKIGELMRSKALWLATAESCTGGLLGHLITTTAGSSDYYLGGFITYSNETKERWLGVAHSTLEQYGAVSRETVQEMARGVRNALGEKIQSEKIIGISISGIAGPGGGSPEKPVGIVWIGVSGADGEEALKFYFQGDRGEVKNQSAEKAMDLLIAYLQK
jgi:nicotinamide-nucleotide amidase